MTTIPPVNGPDGAESASVVIRPGAAGAVPPRAMPPGRPSGPTPPANPPADNAPPGDTSAPPPLNAGYTPPGPGWSVTITARTLWMSVGIVLLTVGLVILLFKAIYVWILLFIAIVVAEGLRPIVNWMHRRLNMPRPLAIFILLIIGVFILLLFAFFFISPFIAQITTLTSNLPGVQQAILNYISNISQLIGNSPQAQAVVNTLQSQAGTILQAIGPFLLSIPLLIAQIILSAVIVVVMVFFWLTGIDRLGPFIAGLFPENAQPRVTNMFAVMSLRIGGYLRGVVINMFVIGILSGVGDWLLGAPYPLILGLVAGLFEALPFIGPWISGGVAILFSFIFADPLKAVEIIVFYIVIQEFEGNTLVPLVMMRAVDLNPLTVLVGVIAGGELLGIIGSILAVPFIAAMQVLITEALVPAARHASARINASDDAHLHAPGSSGGPGSGPPPPAPPPTQPA